MNENQALQTVERGQIDKPLSVEDLIGQVNLIQKVMSAVMKDGEHYGVIPGCGKKPALLQPGAQKLLVTFRLAPEYAITEKMLDRGHREYQVLCTLKTIGSGSFVGQGAGSASSMEAKWRFRVAPKQITDRPVPKSYWDLRQSDPAKAQELIGGKGFSTKKEWMIAEGSSEKIEHDNPADYYNTILKMACKRALVAATLTATAASDIFTQDVEEMVENLRVATVTADDAPVPLPQKPTPTINVRPTQPQAQETPRDTGRSFEEVVDGEKTETVMFDEYKVIHSKPGAKSAWTGWICKFSTDSGSQFEAGTFSQALSEQLEVLRGQTVEIKYRKGRKEGTLELISIAPEQDEIPMGNTP
jgi:hypothetical protein